MLTPSDRKILEAYIKHTDEGAPYRRRIQIVLKYDEGVSPEMSAGPVGVSIIQARAILRAFKRQQMSMFPVTLFKDLP